MRITSIIFFIIATLTLITSLIYQPVIRHDFVNMEKKDFSFNYLYSLNKIDYRYWVIKDMNDSNTKNFKNLYNIKKLTKNQRVLNYINFEFLKNYQQFTNKEKNLFLDK